MKNRGMLLEGIINKTIKKYKELDIAIIHKKPVPVKFSGANYINKKLVVSNAFVASKSTTDYYGIYKGVFITFEAKSTKEKSLPISNIKNHQHEYLKKIEMHGGLSFYIIYFSSYDEFILIESKHIDINEMKSIKREYAINNGFLMDLIYPGLLNIAEIIEKII